jgi:hypothetical protein
VFNVGDLATDTALDYACRLLAAAEYEASLVTVPEELVPEDMEATKAIAQHFLVDSRKAATVLGWRPADPAGTIGVSVRWHLENPPEDRTRTSPPTTAPWPPPRSHKGVPALPGQAGGGPLVDGAAGREPACLLPDDWARVLDAGRLQGGDGAAIGVDELAD